MMNTDMFRQLLDAIAVQAQEQTVVVIQIRIHNGLAAANHSVQRADVAGLGIIQFHREGALQHNANLLALHHILADGFLRMRNEQPQAVAVLTQLMDELFAKQSAMQKRIAALESKAQKE